MMTGARDPFRILAVSTGNVCRSPALEMMLRTGLTGVTDIAVASAGTQAAVGRTIEAATARLLKEGGLYITGFQPRQLHAGLLERADLVLCATRDHRAQVTAMLPSAVRKTFTLLEIGRIAPLIDPQNMPAPDSVAPGERIRAAMPLLRLERGMHRAAAPKDDDVDDPYGRPVKNHQKALDQMIPCVEALLALT
jgi:protein-tyrosine phosphatase